MKVLPTALEGILIIEPDVFGDERGYFMETFHRKRYQQEGVDTELCRIIYRFLQKASYEACIINFRELRLN